MKRRNLFSFLYWPAFKPVSHHPQILMAATATDRLNAPTTSVAVDPNRMYPQTEAEARAGITPTSYAYPFTDLRRYGAIGDGKTDDSGAWQRAITVGKVTIPRDFSFKIVTPGTKSGTVEIRGEGPTSKLLCDGGVLTVTDAHDSVLSNFAVENISPPLTIQRRIETTINTTATLTASSPEIVVSNAAGISIGMVVQAYALTAGSVVKSIVGTTITLSKPALMNVTSEGIQFFSITFNDNTAALLTAALDDSAGRYTPNINDGAGLWDKLTPKQKAQAEIGPILRVTGDRVLIDRVTGRHLSILLTGCNDTTVQNCHLRGGWTWAAIAFLNWAAVRTRNNRAINNTIYDHGFNGIISQGCDGILYEGNYVHGVGETCLKVSPYVIDGSVSGCRRITSSNNILIAGYQGACDYNAPFLPTATPTVSGSIAQGDYAAWCPFGAFGFSGNGWRIDVTGEFNGGPALFCVVDNSVISGTFHENGYDNHNMGVPNTTGIVGSNNIGRNLRIYNATTRKRLGYLLAFYGGAEEHESSMLVDSDLRDGTASNPVTQSPIQLSGKVHRRNVRCYGVFDCPPDAYIAVQKTNQQTVRDGAAAAVVSFDAVPQDPLSWWDGKSFRSINMPAGKYNATATIGFKASGAAAVNVRVYLGLNGSTAPLHMARFDIAAPARNGIYTFTVSLPITVAALTDYIQAKVFCAGQNMTIGADSLCVLRIERLGD